MVQICNKCLKEKDISAFYKHKDCVNGIRKKGKSSGQDSWKPTTKVVGAVTSQRKFIKIGQNNRRS